MEQKKSEAKLQPTMDNLGEIFLIQNCSMLEYRYISKTHNGNI